MGSTEVPTGSGFGHSRYHGGMVAEQNRSRIEAILCKVVSTLLTPISFHWSQVTLSFLPLATISTEERQFPNKRG
jgi:hypothetical protein